MGGYNDKWPSCNKLRSKISPLDWQNSVKYLCLWSTVTIRRSDCENRVVKYCETSSKSIKFGQSLVKLQSWFQDHLTWSNLVDQWGFKWVLGCREGKIPDLSQANIILLSSQNTANYKAPRIATRFYYHYSKTNRNLPSVMQEPITPQHV